MLIVKSLAERVAHQDALDGLYEKYTADSLELQQDRQRRRDAAQEPYRSSPYVHTYTDDQATYVAAALRAVEDAWRLGQIAAVKKLEADVAALKAAFENVDA